MFICKWSRQHLCQKLLSSLMQKRHLKEASEASRIQELSSFLGGANMKPWIFTKSQQVGTWGNFKDRSANYCLA